MGDPFGEGLRYFNSQVFEIICSPPTVRLLLKLHRQQKQVEQDVWKLTEFDDSFSIIIHWEKLATEITRSQVTTSLVGPRKVQQTVAKTLSVFYVHIKRNVPQLRPTVPCGLRRDSIGLGVGSCHRASASLRQHQPRATKDWRVVLLFLLLDFTGLSLLVVFLELLDRRRLLAHVVDHERHTEVVKVVAP